MEGAPPLRVLVVAIVPFGTGLAAPAAVGRPGPGYRSASRWVARARLLAAYAVRLRSDLCLAGLALQYLPFDSFSVLMVAPAIRQLQKKGRPG